MAEAQPVETKNLTPAEAEPLNINGVSNTGDNTPIVDQDEDKAPVDHHSLVYLIFLLHGIGVLLPWNTFLTISKDYFIDYKLANANGTEYHTNFFSYLGACSQVPNLLLNLINLFVIVKGAGLIRRIFISLFIIAVICFFTVVMIFVDSQSWPFSFFLLTMFTVVLLNSANGIYQNSIYGIAADFPWRFTNAIILGNNLCGTFISILAIFSMLFLKDIKWASFVYFGIAFLTVLACIVSFASLPKFAFYRYYSKKAERARDKPAVDNLLNNSGNQEEHENVEKNVEAVENKISLATYLSVVTEAWRQMMDIFLVFFVTLAIFPAVLVKVNFDSQSDFLVPSNLVTPIFIFLNFNSFALLGSFIANYIQWPSPKYLSYVTVPRLLFIPVFLFFNYVPGSVRNYPVLQTNEWAFVILISLMSVSHGYLSSLAMMYAPKAVHESKSQIAGMMSAFVLVSGITAGVLFTFVESYIFS